MEFEFGFAIRVVLWMSEFMGSGPQSQPGGLPFGPLLHAKPPRRPRRLSGPFDTSQDTTWQFLQGSLFSAGESEQQTFDQQQCAFLTRLPFEIRKIIYELVLGHMGFHITAKNTNNRNERLISYICQRPDWIFNEGRDDAHIVCFHAPTERPSSSGSGGSSSLEATGLLPLLVSCRQIYSEAVHVLYSSNTFEFIQSRIAFRFLRLTIPRSRLADIRRFKWDVRIPYHPCSSARAKRDWSDLFAFFANETTGLQHLYLKLQPLHPMQDFIRLTPDTDIVAANWILPMLRMAIDAHNARGCRVEIASNHIVLKPVSIFMASGGTEDPNALTAACVEMHRRIRLSLDNRRFFPDQLPT